jgi:hypothetical protein
LLAPRCQTAARPEALAALADRGLDVFCLIGQGGPHPDLRATFSFFA